MMLGKGHLCAYVLGVASALTLVLIVICLKGTSAVWSKQNSHSSAIIAGRDAHMLDGTEHKHNVSDIPHILHQSWVNGSVPQHFSSWRQSWVRNHKHWEMKLWTDQDNHDLVQQYMPWFLSRYEEYDEPVMKADSVRYLYMHRYGGVYADLDFESLKPLDELLAKKQIVLGTLGGNAPPEHSIPNSFMASAPGHPFWMFCFAKMLSANLAHRVGSYVETMTGPIMLKQALDDYRHRQNQLGLSESDDVVVLPQQLIYPIVWSDPATHYRDCDAAASNFSDTACHSHFPDAYAVTYWAHGWR